jgi:hypothetical protein
MFSCRSPLVLSAVSRSVDFGVQDILAIAERPTAIPRFNYGPNWIGTHRHTHYGSEMQTVDGSIEIGFGSQRTINHLAMTDKLILSARSDSTKE